MRKPKLIADSAYPNMWRIEWLDGRVLSDMTNLTRAADAIACFLESDGARQRGRKKPLEARPCVKSDGVSHGASGLRN